MWDSSADAPRRPHWRGDFGISWSDPSEWHAFEDADGAASESDPSGVGYVMAADNPDYNRGVYGCIDVDGGLDPETGEAKAWVPELDALHGAGVYVERSPSRGGFHVPFVGSAPEWWTDCTFSEREHEGVEVLTNKFVTFTGDKMPGSGDRIPDIDELEPWLITAYESVTGDLPTLTEPDGDDHGADDYDGGEWITEDVAGDALQHVDPDVPYETWRNIGFALRSALGESAALQVFTQWSRRGSKWDRQADRLAEAIITSASPTGGVTAGTLVYHARQGGWTLPPSGTRRPPTHRDREDADASHGDEADPRWREVRAVYSDYEIDDGRARRLAVDILDGGETFAAMRDTEELYRYNPGTGIYEPEGEQYVGRVLDDHLGESYSTYQRDEVVARLKDRHWTNRDEFRATPGDPRICVANGVLDLTTGDLAPHSPSERFIRRIPVEFDPDADCPGFDAFLGDVLGQPEDKALVYEALGLAIHPGYLKAKTLLLYGDGRNGKSTLLDVFERFLGDENVSNRTLHELEYDDFAAADLYGKVANICGDLPSDNLKDTGMLKKLTGGDSVTANAKYKQPFTFRNEAALIFSANDPPAVEDDSTAFYRRLLLLNFPHEFTPPGQPGPDQRPKGELMDEIATDDELSGVLNQAVEAVRRIRETGAFSQRQTVADLRDHYKLISDPVYAFASTCLTDDPDGFVTTDDLYACYVEWCNGHDAPKKAKNVLPQLLQEHVRMERGRGPRPDRPTGYKGVAFTSRGDELLGSDGNHRDDGQQSL